MQKPGFFTISRLHMQMVSRSPVSLNLAVFVLSCFKLAALRLLKVPGLK
jgi:hypothetical protein